MLIAFMRGTMCERLMKPGDGINMAELALGEANAYQITNSFFAMCESAQPWFDEDEAKIARRLRALVIDAIGRRNDIAHGDWWIQERGEHDVLAIRPPTLIRVKPARSPGPERPGPRSVEQVTSSDLDAEAAALDALRGDVTEFGRLALQLPAVQRVTIHPRVRDIFVLKGSGKQARVVREGPKAEKWRRLH